MNEKLLSLLAHLRNERKPPERMVVKSAGRVSFVKVDEIDWIEAEGNYVRLHTGRSSHLLRETMKGMEAMLDRIASSASTARPSSTPIGSTNCSRCSTASTPSSCATARG